VFAKDIRFCTNGLLLFLHNCIKSHIYSHILGWGWGLFDGAYCQFVALVWGYSRIYGKKVTLIPAVVFCLVLFHSMNMAMLL